MISVYAYYRTLRDIHEGHINLYADVVRYDQYTGEPLSEPVVLDVAPDRAPSVGMFDPGNRWWEPMVADGHLALAEGHGRSFYLVTDAGLGWLRVRGYQR